MALSVIGAGVGRTGTASLKLALEGLGFGPCYHMSEVFERLDSHVPLWDAAAHGGPADWDGIFADYGSAVDFPAAAFYREIAAHYPDAKVILTVRDPDRWYKSFGDTILHPLTEAMPEHLAAWGRMVRKAIIERVFAGGVSDKGDVIACFNRHIDEVRSSVPGERLLVYEVSQGWDPLCAFLGVPVPNEPFPKTNTTDEWLERFGGKLKGAATSPAPA